MKSFATLDRNRQPVAILGNRGWPQAAWQEERDTNSKRFRCYIIYIYIYIYIWKQLSEHPTVSEVSLLTVAVERRPVAQEEMDGQGSND